jgi:uncharacterized protein (DUF58 family)
MADDLAAAAASLVSLFDDENFNVSVTIPDDKGANGRGQRHRGNVLRALASIDEHSTWDDTSKQYHLEEEIHDQADVLILGGADSMTVRIGEEEFSFDELLSESESTSRDVRIYSTPATTQSVTDS